ncbi:Dynein regulatory complex subunit 6 [Amphibalanus amphitrite]|uniref:Dynein regulatory complex subunit 6 n=1 Tax=Amphibalanus amphitrite TaxID=1232801 RepID=A0A6A4VWR7_AMPAM|nr:Dynein regulatory complex subunit 6 [Amphibalanus amphitrite]KAF0297339.1 Dynein regulatory complex subunit 6 [Amphibalanus amphitrite]
MTVGYQDGRIVPYEVLVEIFSHLSFSDVLSAGLVCRLWHDVSCHVLRHSRTVCLEGGGAERAAGLLASEEAAPFTRLVLREADVSARGPLAGLWSSAGPGLSVLRLLGCTVKESDLVQILSHCEELEELALVGCDSLFMTGNILSRDSAQQLSLPSLRRLDLSANRYLSDAILQRLLALAPGLEELSLRSCQIGFHPGIYRKFYPGGGAGAVSSSVLTFECVMAFVRERAAAVRALDLSDTNVEDGALADLAAVSELRLETLRLEGCRAATGAGLAALLTAQPRLAELDLSGTRADAATTAAAARLPRLRRLALRRCDRLPAAALEPLAGAALHELDLSENERLPADAAAAALPADGSQLRRLRLRALKLTADCVIRLAGRLSALRELDLSRCLTGVTDSSLQAICRHLPGLEVLRLSECHLVTDSGLTGLGLAGAGPDPAAPLKPNKTFLHGEAGAAQEPAEQPPPSALVTPQRSPHAISLRSRHEREIWSDAGRKQLVQSQIELNDTGSGISLLDLKGLVELDLSQCSRVSDIGVTHVVRHAGLRRLSLAHCPQLGDGAVALLGRHCPALEWVRLAGCASLTDRGLTGLVQHARRLKHLDVQGCIELTDASVRALMTHGASLQYLNVTGCRQVSCALVSCLEEALPRLAPVSRAGLDGAEPGHAPPPPPPPPAQGRAGQPRRR